MNQRKTRNQIRRAKRQELAAIFGVCLVMALCFLFGYGTCLAVRT